MGWSCCPCLNRVWAQHLCYWPSPHFGFASWRSLGRPWKCPYRLGGTTEPSRPPVALPRNLTNNLLFRSPSSLQVTAGGGGRLGWGKGGRDSRTNVHSGVGWGWGIEDCKRHQVEKSAPVSVFPAPFRPRPRGNGPSSSSPVPSQLPS